jgi:hypothetical protein
MTDQLVFPTFGSPSSFTGAMRDFGFEPGNLICAGYDNAILLSRRSTIINGYRLEIQGSYNCHAVGQSSNLAKIENKELSNRFDVHCSAGLYCTGDIVAYQRSDLKLKNNILYIKNATQVLSNISPISYDWNDLQDRYQGHDIGLSAQNVQRYVPFVVKDRGDGYKAINYKKIVPLIVQSIKEKQERINLLKQKIKEIKNGQQ